MPVRRVSNRGGNIIGRFPSLKLERMVALESLIERDFLYLLDFEADVTWFAEQPLTSPYRHAGKSLSYTPDFHVFRDGQNILVECKPQKFIRNDDNQRKFTREIGSTIEREERPMSAQRFNVGKQFCWQDDIYEVRRLLPNGCGMKARQGASPYVSTAKETRGKRLTA